MRPFSFRALRSVRNGASRPSRAALAAMGLSAASALALLPPAAQAQSSGVPFYFPAAPAAQPVQQAQPVQAAPVQTLAAPTPYAQPQPYAAQRAFAPAPGLVQPAPAAADPAGWRGAAVPEPAYASPGAPRPVPAAAPIYNPAPAATLQPPPPQQVQIPQAQGGPILSPRPSAAPSGAANLGDLYGAVVMVDDQPITRFEVEQRARILAAADERAGATPAALIDTALRSLVDDQVKIQAAKAAGYDLTPQVLARGLAEIADQNGMGVEAMLAFFQARGVYKSSVEAQVTAEILWREYLRARYGSRIEPTEQELTAALAADPSRSREQVRSRLLSERAALTSRSLLQDLRRKAVIDMK